MKDFFRRFANVLSVRRCVVCGRLVKVIEDMNLCPDCEKSLNRFGYSINIPDREFVSVLAYEKHVKNHMGLFKFKEKKYLGYTFGTILCKRLKEFAWIKEIDSVVCVPMKGRNRTYNQSAVIANQVAKLLDLPFKEDALVKIKNNPPLYKYKAKERFKIVKGAYAAGSDISFVGEKVLLIDDIYTTGATISECRSELLKSGAASVCCATVCYSTGEKNKIIIK